MTTTTHNISRQPLLPGRLGDPGRVLKTDPRADPRLLALLAPFALDGAPPPAPVHADSPLQDKLAYLAASARPCLLFGEGGDEAEGGGDARGERDPPAAKDPRRDRGEQENGAGSEQPVGCLCEGDPIRNAERHRRLRRPRRFSHLHERVRPHVCRELT